ncbi:MAG: sigma-54-dependent Fis family transcriptional regulator, partial [Myxococcales bacterium]|nr:sigma-54-dependent Fis family transcriptional regulator [Myxococcales bacterium]
MSDAMDDRVPVERALLRVAATAARDEHASATGSCAARTEVAARPVSIRTAGGARAREGFIAASPQMRAVARDVERFAALRWPVLIGGETGAGKEVIARALHDWSPRARGPWVAVNAGALPETLVDAALFGHERGAFTGAVGARRGAFEQASGGTLFLDEVGEMHLDLQARLLRVLERWEVRRLGAETTRPVDVRLVCATHRDLRREVARGRFREDLFYRLCQLPLHVPPLRERPDDLVALAQRFVDEIRPEVGARELTLAALRRLCEHPFPGNVRELRAVVRLAALEAGARTVSAAAVDHALARIGADFRVPG